ncbi:hypothetical protein MMC25_007278 [Agyrium rufum]|nr:hypothetical protein [Agyrium rufum]
MNEMGKVPRNCELNAITAAAIAFRDGNDGVIEGVISDPDNCTFDPKTMIGKTVDCPEVEATIRLSRAAATVANEVWTGPKRADGSLLWADAVISPFSTQRYYEGAMTLDPNVSEYYRLFLAPGLGHCGGGLGAFPDEYFEALVKWVEEGIAPTTLKATSNTKDGEGRVLERPLCPYPKKQCCKGTGDTTLLKSFCCA